MGVVGSIVSFLLIWWLALFMVLPMRVKGIWEDENEHVQGAERGAPVRAQMWFKLKRTTLIAIPVWLVVFAIVSSGVITFER